MKRRNFLNGLTSSVAALGAAGSTGLPNHTAASEGPTLKDRKQAVSELVHAYCLIWYYKTARSLIFGSMSSLIGLMGVMITSWTKLAADIRALNTIALGPIIVSGNWPKSIKNQVKAANRSASKVNRAIKKAASSSKDLDRLSKKIKSLQANWKEKSREFKSVEKRARKAAAGKRLTAEETQKLNEKRARAKEELAKMRSKLDVARTGIEKAKLDLKGVLSAIAHCEEQLKKDGKERQELNVAFGLGTNLAHFDSSTLLYFSETKLFEERIMALPEVEKTVIEKLAGTKPVLKSVNRQLSNAEIETDNTAGALTINFQF